MDNKLSIRNLVDQFFKNKLIDFKTKHRYSKNLRTPFKSQLDFVFNRTQTDDFFKSINHF